MEVKYVFAFLVMLSTHALAGSQAKAPTPDIGFREREVLAATYLGNIQRKSGYFDYEFDFMTGKWSPRDLLVRQAGAGYGLSEYLLTHRDDLTRAVVEKALNAYRRFSIPYQSGKLLTSKEDLSKADSGATALALLAALQYSKATGDHQFDDDVTAWKNGLLALRNSRGGFAYSAGDATESPFYNGEAWLALSAYVANFPQDENLQTIVRSVDLAMIKTYSSKPDMGFFHWGLMAAAKRYETTKDPVFLDFGAQQVTNFLSDVAPKFNENTNSCASIEGLAAILPLLMANDSQLPLATRVATRIRDEMNKNVGFQIVPGQETIALPAGRALVAPEIAQYVGAFTNGLGQTQIRVDYTQHCLSAMLKSDSFMKD